MSLQKVRDSLVYCLADKVIDYEEFVLLYNPYKSKNAAYLYWEYEEFCLDSLSSEAEAFAIHSGSHCHFDTSLGCPEIKLESARAHKSLGRESSIESTRHEGAKIMNKAHLLASFFVLFG